MSLYKILRSAYHSVLPKSVRHAIYLKSPKAVSSVRGRLVTMLEESAPHDDVYDKDYYQNIVEPTMQLSAKVMAQSICDHLRPVSVVDLGCGTGALLMALRDLGVSGRGFEYASAAIDTCTGRGLAVQRLNIETDPCPDARADVAISTEVAEHLPAACADRFVEMLAAMAAKQIVLTAATPGQGGTDHINEQPNTYWITKVERHGFRYDPALTETVRREWAAAGVAHCFAGTVMMFARLP